MGLSTLAAAVAALAMSPLVAGMAQAPSTTSTTGSSSTSVGSSSSTTSAPSTLVTTTSSATSSSCSLVSKLNGYKLVTILECQISTSSLWTSSLTYLADVPSDVLQPKGSNTVTPWDVPEPTPEIYIYPDVPNPLGFPTPSPYPSSLLNPNFVGGGSVKHYEYAMSIGAIIGVSLAAAALIVLVLVPLYLFGKLAWVAALGARGGRIRLGKRLGKGEEGRSVEDDDVRDVKQGHA